MFSKDGTGIVPMNIGMMVTLLSFFLKKYFFHLAWAQTVSAFGTNLSSYGENPFTWYRGGSGAQVSYSRPV